MRDEPGIHVIWSHGRDDLARLYVARTADGSLIEMAESVQPPFSREEKWVLIVSTLKGCPVKCPICDAGQTYAGRLSAEEILAQIDYLVRQRFPDGRVPARKFKIQFARMGEPAFNPAVIDVLRELPARYIASGLTPSISTVAPKACGQFFEDLLAVKRDLYPSGRFQFQFSLHTTDEIQRRELIPTPTWNFSQMAEYGERFVTTGDRRVSLNFAAPQGYALDPAQLQRTFSPKHFMVKLTPVNPTQGAKRARIRGVVDPAHGRSGGEIKQAFERAGYETVLSIGELEENLIGSNCGQTALSLGLNADHADHADMGGSA